MTATILAGSIDLAFAVFHLLFWRLFGWPESLDASGAVNRAITQTMNVMLIYLFAAYGAGLIWLAWQPSGFAALYAAAGAGALLLRTGLQVLWFPMRRQASLVVTPVFVLAAALHGVAALALARL